jgi:segregation and condensation protein A
MDGMVDSDIGADTAEARMVPPVGLAEDGSNGGQGAPFLTLEGFHGPLDHLLALARTQKVDLSAISLRALLDQLTAALQQAPPAVPLGQKGDWVVMAAWLVQLRARLLPADLCAQQDAAAEVGQLRDRLAALQETQTLAGWLERRPQLGHEVFARGQPEIFGVSVETAEVVDVIEFLWASLALFDDDAGEPDTTSVYRPPLRLELHTVANARERILQQLAETPDGAVLDRFLPDMPVSAEGEAYSQLRRRSAWSSTFTASLELARQGEVALAQGEAFAPIHLSSCSDRETWPGR